MSIYISSNANRFYVAPEATFGQAALVTAENRFPANKLELHQSIERLGRPYKTGTRTYLGQAGIGRRNSAFLAKSYLTSWDGKGQPHYGPLFMAALGADVELASGNTVAAVSQDQLRTSQPHGLQTGSAVSLNGEIRFVASVLDSTTIRLNVAFGSTPQVGASLSPAATYRLGASLPSLTLYDYWDPTSAISRFASGAAVNKLSVGVNGDYHEFSFSGPAADVFDSRTFQPGDAGLQSFPAEPGRVAFSSAGVPGHLGHAWIGSMSGECLTLCDASIEVNNNLGVRDREFGAVTPRAIVPGERTVAARFTLLARDDEQTLQLYSAAKQHASVPMMLQLGIQQGRLLGIYLPNVVPELPIFDDADTRLRWTFTNNLAQGLDNDELYMAFA